MATQRAHIVLPQDLIQEIDEAVGPRGRSAFLVETARAALRRRQLLSFLAAQKIDPAWKNSDHPELAKGSAAWVRRVREESGKRFEKVARATRRTA